MPFVVLLHNVGTTGGGDYIVRNSTQTAIIDGQTISFDGGTTFQPYTYLGQGNYRGTGESGEFIQVGGNIYAWDTDDPTGPMQTGNWKIDEGDLDPTDPPCFVAGTLIETDRGPRPVEDLKIGEWVRGAGGQSLPIVWIGQRTLTSQTLRIQPKYRPVRIQRDALGAGLPNRDLYVSPQHRIVLEGWRAELLFGEESVFCAAIHLVNGDTVHQVQADKPVTYYHIACEEHATLTSHGLHSESLYLGDRALKSFQREDVAELLALFPELEGTRSMLKTRLRCLKRAEANALQGLF